MPPRVLKRSSAAAGAFAIGAVFVAGNSELWWNLAWTAGGVCAVLGLLGGREQTAPSQRGAWKILTAAAAVWLAAELVWVAALLADYSPSPALADCLWLAVPPLLAVALARLIPGRGTTRRLAALETVALVVSASAIGGMLLWGPVTASAGSTAMKAVGFAYPVLYAAVPVVVVQGLIANEITPRRSPALYLLVAGTLLEAISFSMWGLALLSGTWRLGDVFLIDGLFPAGMVAIGIGGALHRSRGLAEVSQADDDDRRFGAVLPALMFVAMLVLMVVAAQRGTPMFERYLLVVGMFLVGGVLILRSSLLAARHRGLLASEREALSALSQTRAASARYFGISRDLLSSATLDGRFQEVNPAWESLLGWTQEEMIDRQFMELVHPDDLERTAEQTTQIVTTGAPMMEFENRFRAKDGTYRWLSWRSQYDRDSDLLYVRGSDATERKVLEQELEQLALHDAVTGLPNRTLFADRAAHALASADRDDGCVGMLFIDLDNFKFVNDSYGHEAGDTLLRTVATRLASVLRPHDTVARFAGDEFTVLCPGIAGAGEGSAIGHRILSALGHPIKLGENEIVVSGSVGLAVGHGLDKSVDTLMSEADTAMYRAKEGGRARVEIFDDALRAVASRKMRLERDLRVALDNGDFHLVYQPIVTLDTGYLDKFEALLRWEHPELGAVGPDEFVPIAEETGLIVEIGRWVAEEACRALAGATRSGVGMALNLSARQLLDPGLAGHLVYAATEAGISPELIDLEITETMLVDERQPVLDAIDALKWAGFRLVLDDFGTGYSALGYLKRLPFDLIKIDRSFVAELHASDEDAAIVAAIVAVAQALDLDVVAEGIETPEQLEHLRSLGVAYGQGFHFSHPVPPSDIPAVMTLRPPSPVARLPRRGDRSVAPAG